MVLYYCENSQCCYNGLYNYLISNLLVLSLGRKNSRNPAADKGKPKVTLSMLWPIIKFVFFISMAGFFLYIILNNMGILTSDPTLQTDPEYERQIEALDKQADNLQKYGCRNPEVSAGLVMCP